MTEQEFNHLLETTTGKLSYTFTCSVCGKTTLNESTVKDLKSRYLKQGWLRFTTCRSCSVKMGRKNVDEKSALEKRRKTNQEKYGIDNPFKNSDFVKNKVLEKYGVENISQLPSVKQKKKQTCLSHFGFENPLQVPEIQEKIRDTCLNKYGVSSASKSEGVKETVKKNNLEKFGVEYYTQTQKAREHLRRIWKDKEKKKELAEKVSSTWSQKTEEEFKEIRQKAFKRFQYEGQFFDSSWELAVWIWAKDEGKVIKREPVCIEYVWKGKTHKYFPDFEIDGEIIEIKGNHFLTEDGKMKNIYDGELNGLFEAKHQAGLKNNVIFWTLEEIQPILDYVNKKYTQDYMPLFDLSKSFPETKETNKGDLSLIRKFHKSLYKASKKGKKSPYEAWFDKSLVKKTALNRLKYIGNCKPETIIQGFSVTGLAPRVSVFKPKLAENLIKKHLDEFSEIFDPFSGFSGRMLGTANLKKTYVGQDVNADHVRESNEIIRFKNLKKCSVIQQDILQDTLKEYECLFTCPPYGGKEHWNENNDEIEKSCDEWIDVCLSKYSCQKYLFVVDKTEKYKDNVVEVLHTKTLFGDRQELVILLNTI